MIAFVAGMGLAAVLGLRGADRALLAALDRAGFAWDPPVAVAVLTGGLTAGIMAWAGAQAAALAGEGVRWIAGAVFAAALLRFAIPRRPVVLREPTRSVFAFGLVLAMLQIADATRLAVFALAALTRDPLLAACGAFLGAPIALGRFAPGERR